MPDLDSIDMRYELLSYSDVLDEEIRSLISQLQTFRNHIPRIESNVSRNDIDGAVDTCYTLLAVIKDFDEELQDSVDNIIIKFKTIDSVYDNKYQ